MLSLHAAKSGQSRPADAYVVTVGGLSGSARRAAEAVYTWLQHCGKNPDRFVAGFDVCNAGSSMAGASSGLAFAVALAARLLDVHGLSVAATGELREGQFPAPIARVGGINEKIAAALKVLPREGILLYPQENDADILESLRKQCGEEGIVLCPIRTLAEAFELLFAAERHRGAEKKEIPGVREGVANKATRVGGVVLAVLLGGLLGWWLAVSQNAGGKTDAGAAPGLAESLQVVEEKQTGADKKMPAAETPYVVSEAVKKTGAYADAKPGAAGTSEVTPQGGTEVRPGVVSESGAKSNSQPAAGAVFEMRGESVDERKNYERRGFD